MDNHRLIRAQTLFDELLAAPPEQRSSLLVAGCGGDAELRRLVDQLLRNDDSGMAGFLTHPVLQHQRRLAAPPPRIGRYEIIREIGRGGAGVVYEARQDQPARVVALKVLNTSIPSAEMLRRFEHEAEILGGLQHPGIAQVFEAGALEVADPLGVRSMVPYFAMERVDGEPITGFCDRNKLNIPERLELFEQACRAVQHAHNRGVIHRDIKPSNILAAADGNRRFCKIIDFGIAKLTQPQRAIDATHTHVRQFAGTPEYMSPEQAAGSRDIDTRTDVYSLGVLLYELLTGTTPFSSAARRGNGMEEMFRIIREVEPERPSKRLERGTNWDGNRKTSVSSADSVGASSRFDAAVVRGELDWIVLRAIEKDRARRYDSPARLAADVERYLRGEAVEAAPASAAYRLRKFIRRHRAGVVAGTVVAAALVATTAVSILFAWREAQQRTRAEQAVEAKDEQRKLAEKSARETLQVADFQADLLAGMDADAMGAGIKGLFRDQVRAGLERQYIGEYPQRRKRTEQEIASELAAYDAIVDGALPADVARRVIDQHLLRDAAQTVRTRFADQPLVAAQLLDTLGAVFVALGLPDQAAEPLETALALRETAGDASAAAAATHDNLGRLCSARNELPAAEHHHREAFRLYEALGPAQRENAAGSLINLGHCLTLRADFGPAASVLEDALARVRALHGPAHRSVAVCLLYLGKLHHAQRTPARGEPVLRDALDIFGRNPDAEPRELSETRSALGLCLIELGRAGQAEPLLTDALKGSRELFGDEHVNTLACLNNLGWASMEQGKLAQAEEYLRQALDLLRKLQGDDAPGVPVILINLSAVLQDAGRLEQAEPVAREAVDLARRLLGLGHPDTLRALNGLATCFFRQGDFSSAETMQREVLELRRKKFGERSPEAAVMMGNLASSLASQRRYSEAEPLVREALAIYDASLLSSAQPAASARNTLVRTLIGLARDESAAPQQRAAWLEQAEPMALAAARNVEGASATGTFIHSVLQSCVVLYEARHALAPDEGHEQSAKFWGEKLRAWQTSTQPARRTSD